MGGKSNEITAIPLLLERLALDGALVTIDAIGAQNAIAATILRRGGDYLLALKENRPAMFADVEAFFADPPPAAVDTFETTDGGHGRIEVRRHAVCRDVAWLFSDRRYPGEVTFPGLATIGMVESITERGGGVERARRYCLSSARLDAASFARAVRAHWGIENRLHWVLDVVFKDDLARLRTGHGPANMAVVRHMAVNLLRQARPTVSLKNRRKRAGWNIAYLESAHPADRVTRRSLDCPAEDRHLRFGGRTGEDRVRAYCARLDRPLPVVLGYLVDGVLRAVGELKPIAGALPPAAELAVSVEAPFRGRGVGTGLCRRLLVRARNRLIARVHMLCLLDNRRVHRIGAGSAARSPSTRARSRPRSGCRGRSRSAWPRNGWTSCRPARGRTARRRARRPDRARTPEGPGLSRSVEAGTRGARPPGHGSAARVYLPPASSTCPVTVSRIKVLTTSCLSCRPASASTTAALVRGMPSASSSRMAGAILATMVFILAEPMNVLALDMRVRR